MIFDRLLRFIRSIFLSFFEAMVVVIALFDNLLDETSNFLKIIRIFLTLWLIFEKIFRQIILEKFLKEIGHSPVTFAKIFDRLKVLMIQILFVLLIENILFFFIQLPLSFNIMVDFSCFTYHGKIVFKFFNFYLFIHRTLLNITIGCFFKIIGKGVTFNLLFANDFLYFRVFLQS